VADLLIQKTDQLSIFTVPDIKFDIPKQYLKIIFVKGFNVIEKSL